MNTKHIFKALAISAVVLGVAFPAVAKDNPSKSAEASPGNALQVSVDLPPSWHVSVNDDEVAEVFGDYVHSVFDRMGYKGDVNYVDAFETRPEDGYRLDLRIIRWRVNRIGNIECEFTANLATPRGEKHLGFFSDMVLSSITGHDRFLLADSFEDAAKGAIRDLYQAVAKAEMVPGLRYERT